VNGVLEALSSVSLWIWLSILAVVALGGLPLMYVVGGKRGKKRANGGTPEPGEQSRSAKWKDRILFALAVMVGALVYGCVVYGSFKGLTAFGDTIGFNRSNDWIVPVTLDGVAAAFGFLAFRAVLRKSSPTGCYMVVWLATGSSALFNYLHGDKAAGGAGGLYFAFLSLVGMLLFHVFMKQFRAKAGEHEYRPAKYPPFGLRWITAPYTTLRALVVWINYPPREAAPVTVRESLRHLAVYDRAKSVRRAREAAAARDAARASELAELTHRREKAEQEAEVQAAESRAKAAAEVDVEAFRREVGGEVRAELEARYEQQVAELEAQYGEQAAKLTAEQEETVARFREQLEQLGGERDSGRDEAAALRRKLADAQAAGERAAQEAARYREQLTTASGDHETVRTRLAELAEQVSAARGREAQARRELEGMQAAAERANREAAAARGELERAYQARSGDVDGLAAARREVAELEAEVRRAREAAEAAVGESAGLRRELATIRQERDRAVADLRAVGAEARREPSDDGAVIGRGSTPPGASAPNGGGRRAGRQETREPEPVMSATVPAPRADAEAPRGQSDRHTVMGWLDAAYLAGSLRLDDRNRLSQLCTDYAEQLGVKRETVTKYARTWREEVTAGKRKPAREPRLTLLRPSE
jgi:uncharacterized protein DUF2637